INRASTSGKASSNSNKPLEPDCRSSFAEVTWGQAFIHWCYANENYNADLSLSRQSYPPKSSRKHTYTPAANSAETGIVRIQATTMFPAIPHRTAENRFVIPTPMIEVEMT